MQESIGTVTMRGNPLTLVGNELQVRELAPDLVILDNNLSPVKLSPFQSLNCIISYVPSLDTPAYDMEIRRFNEETIRLVPELIILTTSMDLPFA